MEYGGIGEGSSSSIVTLPIPIAVYSSSAVCGGIDGGASVLSSVTGSSYGFSSPLCTNLQYQLCMVESVVP